MSGIIGASLVVASILLFAWAILSFRNPDRPAWIDRSLVLEMSACVVVGLLVFGVALQLRYALEFQGAVSWALSLLAIALPAIAYFVVWRGLRVESRLAKFAAQEAGPKSLRPSPQVEALRKQA